MSEQSYNPAVARDAEANLAQTAASLQANLDALRGKVQAASSQWVGPEQETYLAKQAMFDNGAATLTNILRQVTAALGRNTDMTTAMQARVQSTLNGG